jgi:hypothetical protein
MVIMVFAPVVPGTTVGGLKATVAPGGRPVAESVTTLLYAPPSGGTVMVISADSPCATGIGVVGALMV